MDMLPQETEGEDGYGQEAPSDLDMTDPGLMTPDSQMVFDPPEQQPKQKVPGLGLGGLGLGGGNKGGGFALDLAGLKPDGGPQQE